MVNKAPAKLRKKPKYRQGPLWDWTTGFTQSGIESFLACREQFALGYIEGWTPRAFDVSLEFGSMFHAMVERQGSAPPEQIASDVTSAYIKNRKKTLDQTSFESLEQTTASVQNVFPLYVAYWANEDSKYKWVQREHIFKVEHTFLDVTGKPKHVTLTGMRDGEYRTEAGTLGLFETKTKSQIDDIAIQDGLRADFQTLFYLYSLFKEYEEPPREILYNVVRRPQLRQKVGESYQEFGQRIAADCRDRPEWYFRRFEVTVLPQDLDTFVTTTLNPVLVQAHQWWESIKNDPFSRWGSPYHFRNLHALTNRYGKCRLYNLMVRGRANEYFRRSSPFPELESSLLPKE